jgi:prevent-host-death family protein
MTPLNGVVIDGHPLRVVDRLACVELYSPRTPVMKKHRAAPAPESDLPVLSDILGSMDRVTATQASRSFSDLLNRVQAGEEIEIVRNGAPVAVIAPPPKPPRPRTAAEIQAVLDALEPFDEEFERDVDEARRRAGLAGFYPGREDPWAES